MIHINDTSLLSISCNKLLYSFDFFFGGGSMKSAPTCILFSRNATKANSKFLQLWSVEGTACYFYKSCMQEVVL